MIAYVLRRMLYAIPILLGVNMLVFLLFFFVNTPDAMARKNLSPKHQTPERVDQWKREHSLDLPNFINNGWRRIGGLASSGPKNSQAMRLPGPGRYRMRVEAPENKKLVSERVLRIRCSDAQALQLPDAFDANGVLKLPAAMEARSFAFEVSGEGGAGSEGKHLELMVDFDVETPAPAHRLVVQYKGSIGLGARFTRTIFYQRSLKMLAFQYGQSDNTGKLIGDELLKRIPPTLLITVPSFFTGLFLCVFFAMLSAFFRGTYVDYWGVFLCVVGMSISLLFYIIGGQVVFGKWLRLVPISGFDYGFNAWKFILLPLVIAIIGGLGGQVRFYRTVFLEEINRDYVRTARAKGLAEGTVLFIHVLKNAMIPILTSVVVSLPFLYSGSLLLESFFSIPGTGAYMLDAIRNQDFATVQALVSLGSFIYVVALALTDISYTLVDPRVRLE